MYLDLKKIVPKKFLKESCLQEYDLLIKNHWPREINYMITSRGNIKKIPASAFCFTVIYNKKFYLLVSQKEDANLFQSILLFSNSFFIGNRIHRFLNLYKSYECLTSKPNPIMKSIRDGLSHPSSVLTNKITKQNLLNLFGVTLIDLNNYKHLKIFYTHLGKLFIENDKEMFNRIKNGLNNYIHLKSSSQLIKYDWELSSHIKKV